MSNNYDFVVIGAGVTGAALLYILSEYTDIKRLALIEKNPSAGEVNSNAKNNSQTLHFGDIETNYNLEKALSTKAAAEMVANYLEKFGDESIYKKYHKIALGVGDKNAAYIKNRYEEFKKDYSKIKLYGREDLAKIEPNVIKGRDPKESVAALFSPDGYTVDYGRLAESFISKSNEKKDKVVDVLFSTRVEKIKKEKNGIWQIKTNKGIINASAIAMCAGSYSLYFAQKMGYGKEKAIMSVAGNFYFTPKMLNGKVYTCQERKLPFAAVHGDPDLKEPKKTRYGPTADVILLMERRNWKSLFSYLRMTTSSPKNIFAIIGVLLDPTYFSYGIKNLFFKIPFLGKWLFLRQIRKIVPTAKYSDLKFAKGYGGARPQLVDRSKRNFELGESKIIIAKEKIIFNITPSPGASKCLGNAFIDAQKAISFLDKRFSLDKKRLEQELVNTGRKF